MELGLFVSIEFVLLVIQSLIITNAAKNNNTLASGRQPTSTKPKMISNDTHRTRYHNDHMADEQRLAVQIITTDESDYDDPNRRRLARDQSSLLPLEEQFNELNSPMSSMDRQAITGATQQSEGQVRPRSITVSLRRLDSAKNDSSDAKAPIARVTVGLMNPDDTSNKDVQKPPIATDQGSSTDLQTDQPAGNGPVRVARKATESQGSKSNRRISGGTDGSPGRMRDAVLQAVMQQGGIPAMVVDRRDIESGNIAAKSERGKLMLNSELLDNVTAAKARDSNVQYNIGTNSNSESNERGQFVGNEQSDSGARTTGVTLTSINDDEDGNNNPIASQDDVVNLNDNVGHKFGKGSNNRGRRSRHLWPAVAATDSGVEDGEGTRLPSDDKSNHLKAMLRTSVSGGNGGIRATENSRKVLYEGVNDSNNNKVDEESGTRQTNTQRQVIIYRQSSAADSNRGKESKDVNGNDEDEHDRSGVRVGREVAPTSSSAKSDNADQVIYGAKRNRREDRKVQSASKQQNQPKLVRQQVTTTTAAPTMTVFDGSDEKNNAYRSKDPNYDQARQRTNKQVAPSGNSRLQQPTIDADCADGRSNIDSGDGMQRKLSSPTKTKTSQMTTTTPSIKRNAKGSERPAGANKSGVKNMNMSDRVADLLGHLKLYTTKEQLMKIVNDIGGGSANQKQGRRRVMKILPMMKGQMDDPSSELFVNDIVRGDSRPAELNELVEFDSDSPSSRNDKMAERSLTGVGNTDMESGTMLNLIDDDKYEIMDTKQRHHHVDRQSRNNVPPPLKWNPEPDQIRELPAGDRLSDIYPQEQDSKAHRRNQVSPEQGQNTLSHDEHRAMDIERAPADDYNSADDEMDSDDTSNQPIEEPLQVTGANSAVEKGDRYTGYGESEQTNDPETNYSEHNSEKSNLELHGGEIYDDLEDVAKDRDSQESNSGTETDSLSPSEGATLADGYREIKALEEIIDEMIFRERDGKS